MSDLINYADYDRAEIFGFDDPEDPLWAQSAVTEKEDDKND